MTKKIIDIATEIAFPKQMNQRERMDWEIKIHDELKNAVVEHQQNKEMSLSEMIRFVKDKPDSSDYLFTRKFFLEHSQHDSWEEKLCRIFYVNLKGRVNNLFEGYQPYESTNFHTDSIAASDWIFVTVDKDKKTIQPK